MGIGFLSTSPPALESVTDRPETWSLGVLLAHTAAGRRVGGVCAAFALSFRTLRSSPPGALSLKPPRARRQGPWHLTLGSLSMSMD